MGSTRDGGFALHSVIAMEFEDCMERFHVLCSALQTSAAVSTQIRDDFFQSRCQFLNWGRSSGAADRSLDYVLHKNSNLRLRVTELLEGFNAALQTSLALVQRAALPLLSPAIIENSQPSYFDLRPGDHLRPGRDVVEPEDIENSYNDIIDIVNRLTRLSPSLADPFPIDLFYSEEKDGDSVVDINLTSKLFPKASSDLKQRLGKANWCRRLFLRSLRARLHQERYARSEGLMTPGGVPHIMTPPPQSHVTRRTLQVSQPARHHREILGSATSRRTSASGSQLAGGSFWSRADSHTADTATSVDDSDDVAQTGVRSVPDPPAPLAKDIIFQCPYCGQDIVVGETSVDQENRYLEHLREVTRGSADLNQYMKTSNNSFARIEVSTSADWTRHVLADLEPYCCTIDSCETGSQTYISVDEWLQHELTVHRSPKVWKCDLCGEQYRDPALFESHLGDVHSMIPEQVAVLIAVGETYSDERPDLTCSLCTLSCGSLDSYRMHVGSHLQQLALASIDEDDKPEELEPISPYDPRASADYGRLDDFVFSTIKYLPKEVLKTHLGIQESAELPTGDTQAIKGRDVHQASQSGRQLARPAAPQRGPSYTFMSDVRRQQAQSTQHVGGLIASMDIQDDPNIKSLKRTNPPPQNMDFVGRISEMKTLHQELSEPGSICILSGVGGLGKSSLAAEYTYRFEPEYNYIFWVQAESPMVCVDTFSQIATKATGADFKDLDEQRLVTLSREFLESTPKRWLVVFDNVDQELDLRRFLPSPTSQTTGSVLITTNRIDIRLPEFAPFISYIHLKPLTLEESRQLLLSATGQGDEDIQNHPEYGLAGDIAKRAQRLPLALSLIAGYVMVEKCTLYEFVNLWNERRKTIRSTFHGDTIEDSEQAMEAAWDLSLREIPTDSQKLLQILAFLDPDHIQKDLLVGMHDIPGLDFLRPSESYRYTKMTGQLRKRRLIAIESKQGEELISIHRKLQAKILRDLGKDIMLRNRVFDQVFHLVRARFPRASPIQVPEPEKWPICKKYLPHVLCLQKLAFNPAMDLPMTVELARLFSDGGIDLWERGMTVEGLELLKCAEALLDQLNVDEPLLRADIHVIVSLLLQDSGLVHIAECKDRIETTLEARKQYQSKCDPAAYTKNDEILLYNAWSDYACVLLQFNMYDEAQPTFNACLEQYTRWGSPESIPYEYAKFHHHVAFCLMYNNRNQEAVQHAEQGLKWVGRATGESAATYRWMFDLGCILIHAQNLKPALETHNAVLQVRLRLHGKFGFLTLESYYAVAACHHYLGNLAEAEAILRTIVELERTRPGSCNAAALARTQFHLAWILLLKEEGSLASQGPTSDTTTTDAAGGNNAGPTIHHEDSTALIENDRQQEAHDLIIMATKVLDENKAMGTFKHLSIDKPEARRYLDETGPMALYDLMQPVFDGRFVGKDVLEFLWIVKGKRIDNTGKEGDDGSSSGRRRQRGWIDEGVGDI